MKDISMKEEPERYNLEGEWNDHIGVQKEILEVLRKEKYFDDTEIINKKMDIPLRHLR